MSFFIYSYETTTRQESKRNIKKLLDISFEVEMQEEVEGETVSQEAKQQIAIARKAQLKRFNKPEKLNADMTNKDVKQHARLNEAAKTLLDTAAEKFGLSARSYMRTVKVARTIADLADSPEITAAHVAEALQYRPHQFHDQ
jgi:magnesium chelatase family protein